MKFHLLWDVFHISKRYSPFRLAVTSAILSFQMCINPHLKAHISLGHMVAYESHYSIKKIEKVYYHNCFNKGHVHVILYWVISLLI